MNVIKRLITYYQRTLFMKNSRVLKVVIEKNTAWDNNVCKLYSSERSRLVITQTMMKLLNNMNSRLF